MRSGTFWLMNMHWILKSVLKVNERVYKINLTSTYCLGSVWHFTFDGSKKQTNINVIILAGILITLKNANVR